MTRYFGQLNVSYRVRVYPSVNAIRVATVVDNTLIDSCGNLTYDFDLSLGRSNPQSVFAKTGFTHWHSARWHKVFWQGATPPRIETRYDLAYWIKGGFLPSYDTSLVVPSSTISGAYSSWNSSAHDIMQAANLTKYFPTNGGRSEIGPHPQWTSLYIRSMDYRMAEVVINHGDLYYLEEMHSWACCDLGCSNGAYRGYSQGLLIDSPRGNGWAFRNIIDAAAMTPDDMPEKAYLNAKYDPQADFNADFGVDVVDLLIFVENFGL